MPTLDITAELALTDGTYQITGTAGSLYRLKNLATGATTSEHLADITSRLVEAPAWPETSPRVLDVLTPADRAEVELWANHIEEMITGLRPGHATPRPEYDPKRTSQNERVMAKVTELNGRGLPASRAALFRKKTLYQMGGAAALIDQRKNKCVGKLDRADKDVIEAIAEVAATYTNKSTVTQSYLHTRVRKCLEDRLGSDAPELPSRATLYRYFDALTKGRYTTGKATTRRSTANTPNRTYRTARLLLPGEEVQVDSTPMDLLVRVPGMPEPMRPILTVMLDKATRSIIAATIRVEAAKGYDHALLLTQALVPYQNRPDRTDHRALLAARHPEHKLLNQKERAHAENTRPFIFPRRILSDNGKDYLSTVFISACKKYGIDIVHSAIHTPTDKPNVERVFQTINTLFTQRLPGYVGNHVVDRGVNVEDEDLLDIATLSELLDDWIVSVYQNKEHDGLRDPFEPSTKFSPNQAYAGAIQFSGTVAYPLTRDDYIDLLPLELRTIGNTGIQFKNRFFDAAALHPLRNTASNFPGRGGLWEVKFNPYDHTHVWVRGRDNNWIECAWRELDVIRQPFFADVANATRQAHRADIARRDAERAGTPMPEGRAAPIITETRPVVHPTTSDTDTDTVPIPADFIEFDDFSYED